MIIADENQNPKPVKKLAKSLDAIAALRIAMEQRLAEADKSAPTAAAAQEEQAPSVSPKATPVAPLEVDMLASPAEDSEKPSFKDNEPQTPEARIQATLANDVVEASELVSSPAHTAIPNLDDPSNFQQATSETTPSVMTSRPDPVTGAKISAPKEQAEKYGTSSAPSSAEPPKMSPNNTTNDTAGTGEISFDPAEWSRIMLRIAERSQKLVQEFMDRNKNIVLDLPAFDPGHVTEAFAELTGRILNDPESFVDAQISLWQGYIKIWQAALARMQGDIAEPVISPAPSDKRFQSKEWQSSWLFDFIKQSYLLTAQWANSYVRKETENLDPRLARKLDFYMRQMVDAISPSNFWLTNPEVLRATLDSGGENLVKGLENMLADLERGHGQLRISMTDSAAFKVGGNLAVTPGKVIYQNSLMQLIQYAPQTAKVHKTPLLLIPPWINKFYILDLREKNSFIRHMVQEGHTVFCISWVNPDERHADIGFDDYMAEGALAAMREVQRATEEESINVLGYCIGGTLLAGTLAYLDAAPSPSAHLPKIKSATYLVALTDFSEPGELAVFMDEDQIKVVEERMKKRGYLDAASMAMTFNMLRANDLIWSFVVNNYLLGREPFPFDILYWNADSTNLPAAMQSFYLRKLYLENLLVKPNGVKFKNVAIDLRRVETPAFMLSTRDDHIAPWRSTYCATQIYSGPVKFVLSGSGHIAGVINPPVANKYGYWTNDKCPKTADAWMADAERHEGSWWPLWFDWLKDFSGEQVTARKIGESIEAAPGSYVQVRAL